ncbi:hypothetical protein AGMMS49546_14370 [Spirochaetia bacterium]|nr:hypothetical protein AGMMS49546_14370 [Spirochaetia bacterium]
MPSFVSAFFIFLFFSFSPVRVWAQEPTAEYGELVLRAWQHTYPEKVSALAWQDGDWTIRAGDETFYWAEGRLLPAAQRNEVERWSPHVFDFYPPIVPPPEIFSPLYIESLRREAAAESRTDRDNFHRAFQGKIYGGLTRNEAEANLARLNFLGKPLAVHRDIVPALARVEESILKAAAGDKECAAFVISVGQVGGYNWREIQGTARMSYHSWGLAVDIQPERLGSKAIYWRWEQARNPDWMLIPLERRWSPPAAVIRAFENEGFIWGGKWGLFDNMHFEFRPELHEINRLLMSDTIKTAATRGQQNPPQPTGRDLHHLYPADIKIRN